MEIEMKNIFRRTVEISNWKTILNSNTLYLLRYISLFFQRNSDQNSTRNFWRFLLSSSKFRSERLKNIDNQSTYLLFFNFSDRYFVDDSRILQEFLSKFCRKNRWIYNVSTYHSNLLISFFSVLGITLIQFFPHRVDA